MASLVSETERNDDGGERSPGSPHSPRPVLATMTPVPVHDFQYCHKVEMDSNDGYPPEVIYADKNIPPEMYPNDKTTIMYQHSPADMLAYDGEKSAALAGDMYDQDMGHIDEKTPIDLIYEDGKQTVIYTTTPDQKRVEMISGHTGGSLDVSVVVHPEHGQPGQAQTVLVLADHMLDDMGQVIGIPRYVKFSEIAIRMYVYACI